LQRAKDWTMSEHSASLLVIFGATGDVARRMLLPALYAQERDGMLEPGACSLFVDP
jgi:glucose-6-phosphate 1-dehydrogenase